VGITLSDNQSAIKGVQYDFNVRFGARVNSGDALTLTISDEFFRNDAG
jgi:hypothetical protein